MVPSQGLEADWEWVAKALGRMDERKRNYYYDTGRVPHLASVGFSIEAT
jgi:hypothetical protein